MSRRRIILLLQLVVLAIDIHELVGRLRKQQD